MLVIKPRRSFTTGSTIVSDDGDDEKDGVEQPEILMARLALVAPRLGSRVEPPHALVEHAQIDELEGLRREVQHAVP